MFRVFLAFSIFFAIDITQLNSDHTLAFLEFLVFNQVSQASINNYLSAVKTMLQLYGIQTAAFRDYRVSYFTKTLKLKVPALGKSPHCPVRALKAILAITLGSDNSPLFQVKVKTKWFPLTDSRLRKNLAIILAKLGLATSNITFHAFRRSGATLAFNSSVPLQDIQSHGTRTSDCVWSYITPDHNASQVVAQTFASLLAS